VIFVTSALRAGNRCVILTQAQLAAHDPYLPVAMAHRQREAFPSADVEILAGSGHWPFADDPDAVGRVVEPFLRRVESPVAVG
jgi:pimeloyl-ACP methyl ester carboxylesterase